ncbi:hypothetical protein [Halocatena marina]|uniref:Asparagine synthetase domain-containing protein n=1 Tax=Halocatena marina TaxID=2934937 RepID=A0ABD5YRE3_9EURY|nr:hypothetical protein [Halocatena marina]
MIQSNNQRGEVRVGPTMNRQLFGVFGDRAEFSRLSAIEQFDHVIEGDSATVGIRDVGYGLPGRTTVYESDDGICLIWGEIIQETPQPPAKRLLERYAETGKSAFDELNGSYLAFVEHKNDALLITDPIRSWEAFYTDAPGVRAFGTDAAKVARTIPDPQLDDRTVAEIIHFGTSFSDSTVVTDLKRIPFDGYLTPDSVGELRRFVYRPKEFDYVGELAARLQRAIERRVPLPGQKGLLLGPGCDSRIVLSQHPELDAAYTVGSSSTACTLAGRHGVEYAALPISERSLDIRPEVIQYTQGIRESVHIHHRGNTDAIDADTIYHGTLFDTLLRGQFLPAHEVELFGRTVTFDGLDPNPDITQHVKSRFGCAGAESIVSDDRFPDTDNEGRRPKDLVEPSFESCWDRTDSVYNAIDLFSIKQTPTLAFRTHLADHFLESFIAADRDLIEWHLTTPPEYRTERTFRAALERLDATVLGPTSPVRIRSQHHPIEGFLERIVPDRAPFGNGSSSTSNPSAVDLDTIYETDSLDQKLFPGYDEIHSLPARVKLRMNDLITWIEYATGEPRYTPDQLLSLF